MSKHRGLVCVFARGKMLFIAALLLFAGPASAEDKEPFAVVPLGGAAECGLPDRRLQFRSNGSN
jgi:hypothetical protein